MLKKLDQHFLWLGLLLLVLVLVACGDEATIAPTTSSPSTTTLSATTGLIGNTSPSNTSVTPTGATPITQVATTARAATTVPTTTVAATTSTRPATSPTTEGSGGLTMKGAFALVDPAVKGWQSDAVYLSIFNPPDSNVGMDSEGRSLQWYFEVLSPATLKRSNWLVKSSPDGKATATKSTEDVLAKDRAQLFESRKLPPINDLIDTKQLFEIARQNGATKSDRPVGTRLARSPKEGDPLAFDLIFYTGDQVLRLRIDAQTGKLVENVKG